MHRHPRRQNTYTYKINKVLKMKKWSYCDGSVNSENPHQHEILFPCLVSQVIQATKLFSIFHSGHILEANQRLLFFTGRDESYYLPRLVFMQNKVLTSKRIRNILFWDEYEWTWHGNRDSDCPKWYVPKREWLHELL